MQKKKSLGQHFLHNMHYVHMVARAADIEKKDIVLEIGPGGGALTRELLDMGATVVAVEKDHRLIPLLQETFTQEIHEKRLRLVEGDALSIAPRALKLTSGRFKLVANIPYYITGALFRTFLSGTIQPSCLVFLVQKEVAQRIARSKKESILSLSVKVYGDVDYVHTVPRGAFNPPPDVDSAILRVSHISRKNFQNAVHEKKFFILLHAGFAQKRKLLKRNIESIFGTKTVQKMSAAGIPEHARAEDVTLPHWVALSK